MDSKTAVKNVKYAKEMEESEINMDNEANLYCNWKGLFNRYGYFIVSAIEDIYKIKIREL